MSSTRQAVIMAGGEGTRLRPLTLNKPKPLLPVAGKACIDYVIEGLYRAGVKDIIITTGYRAAQLISHTGGGSRYGDIDITYSIEDIPMGTAGGVKKMERYLNDTFIVASGDVVADIDFSALVKFHRSRDAEATMALTTVEEPTQFGIVGADPEGRIERFKEKPKAEEVFSNLINAGIYVIEPTVLELIPENTKFDFSKQLFPSMLKRGRGLFATPLTGLWKDIGDPFDLIEINLVMIERKGGFVSPISREEFKGVTIEDPFSAGEETKIGEGCKISGAALYPGARVGKNSEVVESMVLDRAGIGKECRLKNSFVGEDAIIGEGSVLEHCVVGDGQEVPPGTRLKDARMPED